MLPASLLTAGAELEARVRDLARNGALAETHRPPAEGSEVVLVCSGIVAPATVVWVIGRRFGLEFHDPISAEAVDLLTGRRTG